MAASFAFSSQVVAADIDAGVIADALGQASQIGVGTQFVVNGQPYSVTACNFKTQGYTNSSAEQQMLASIKLADFLKNPGHLRFNTTFDKTPLIDALGAGFQNAPTSSDFSLDLELFIRSRFPECGASLLLAAKKIDPSELRQEETTKEELDIDVDSKNELVREKLRQHGLLEFDASKREYIRSNDGLGIPHYTFLFRCTQTSDS